MSDLPSSGQDSKLGQLSVSSFGYELIREILLPELLGKDSPEILYWAGKRIARKFPLTSFEEIVGFFEQADWGRLTIKEQTRKQMVLELESELVSTRLSKNSNSTFQLEAGFIAQQIEFQKKVSAEAFEHPNKRSSKIQFTVKWDKNDLIE